MYEQFDFNIIYHDDKMTLKFCGLRGARLFIKFLEQTLTFRPKNPLLSDFNKLRF